MRRLQEIERKVLAYSQLSPDLSSAQISNAIDVKERSVRYALHNLLSEGLLTYHPFIDFYKLGFTEYAVFLSFDSVGLASRDKIVKYICNSNIVHWVAQLGGDYHLIVAIMAQHILDVGKFLSEIRTQFGSMISKKTISVRVTVDLFNRKFLYPVQYPVDSLSFGRSKEIIQIDEVDETILGSFGLLQSKNTYDVCRQLGLAPSSLKYRVDRLRRDRVFLGSFYWLNPFMLGLEAYRLLIYTKGNVKNFDSELFEYCKASQYIVNLITCLGEWDYEIGVEVPNQHALMDLCQEITSQFMKSIEHIGMYPVFSFSKVTTFPFATHIPLKKAAY